VFPPSFYRKVYDLYRTIGIELSPRYAAIDAMHLGGNIVKHVLESVVLNENMYSEEELNSIMDIVNGRLASIEWMVAYSGRKPFSFTRWHSWPSSSYLFFFCDSF
jgi:hypothetical protein